MPDYGQPLMFGTFLPPDARDAGAVVELAVLADQAGLDVIGVQDHPYNPRFLDTWTLLAVLAARTERIRLFPDVANVPLRPPAMFAKAAATLDILSGGRVELGLGAGAGVGGPQATLGTPGMTAGDSVSALEEAIGVLRTLWKPGAGKEFDGRHYQLRGAAGGPAPAHRIEIWLGAYGPRMLRLTGRLADGWVPSQGYAGPARMRELSAELDDAARAAGRDPADVRRVYNLNPDPTPEELTEFALDLGVSVFVVPPSGDPARALRRLAEETAPAVREAVAQARATSGVLVREERPASQPTAP
ncbi:LLM class flavin-dependent oxidoreductase [Catenulispora subtropica]|uniref:LLM class flavin-dependent oxidoreductase n=1 Tax=Catenulispora subtropica TaxID=450798 RepID=A0ABN2SU55_9ACTN